MEYRNWHWRVADRQRFIEILTETGNPQVAADAIDLSLAAAYRMRARWPQLANEWQQALGVAWEQVEMRVLSTLLEGPVDAKVALEMLKRRAPPPRQMLTVDAAKMSVVRGEIRKLMAPGE